MVGHIRCSNLPRSGAPERLLGRDRPDEAGQLAGAGDDDLLRRLAAGGHPLPAGMQPLLAAPGAHRLERMVHGLSERTRATITLAESVDMPDLSGLLYRNTMTHAFRNWLSGQGLDTLPARPLLTNLVRLVDKAMFEYEQARECLNTYVSRPANESQYTLLYFRAVDHLESCVNALHRAVLFAEQLKRDQAVPKIEKAELLSSAEVAEVNALRDASEHLDEQVAAGKLDPVMPVPWPDAVEFAGREVTYKTLARWLTKLQKLAERFVEHDPHVARRV